MENAEDVIDFVVLNSCVDESVCCSLGKSSCHSQGLVPEPAVVGAYVSYIYETVDPGFKDGVCYPEVVCNVTLCSAAVKMLEQKR